jgi:hypothetical protein
MGVRSSMVSGGTWRGCIYDADRIATRLAGG